MYISIREGDCIERMREIEDCCVDSVVTDPPYGLGFMGKKWDALPPGVDVFRECLRILKPGGHILAFGGSRTYHRLAVAVEDAGFEIRDQIMWLYGSGFPKSQNVSKAIDKAAGVERTEVRGVKPGYEGFAGRGTSGVARDKGSHSGEGGFHRPWMEDQEKANAYHLDMAPETAAAKQWDGWGTALKPAHEPIVVARKPLEGTVANNVTTHGVGALNIDGCRNGTTGARNNGRKKDSDIYGDFGSCERVDYNKGRWPANLIHDGSDEATAGMGAASRYFYCAKASKKGRGEGNNHPTVKPTELMRYLVRLVTPPGGTVLDPFMGSGSTGKAAALEGFGFIGMELESEYVEIALRRIDSAINEKEQSK